jgi:hypothetical protein
MLAGIVELRDVIVSDDIDSVRELAIHCVPLILETSVGVVAYERAVNAKYIEIGPVDRFAVVQNAVRLFRADGEVALVREYLFHKGAAGAGVSIVNRRELPSGVSHGSLIPWIFGGKRCGRCEGGKEQKREKTRDCPQHRVPTHGELILEYKYGLTINLAVSQPKQQ